MCRPLGRFVLCSYRIQNMCGIVGVVSKERIRLEPLVREMAGCLQHRGPDSDGVWTDRQQGVALGHRRLSIIDPSPSGRQPMCSSCGRYVIVYNGEIYNHHEIRESLEATQDVQWRGHSDTEVLLESVRRWGVHETLDRAAGMFVFGIWDQKDQTLYLGRDRMGQKPLYFGWVGNSFVFASELKALCRHPEWEGKIDEGALCQYFHYSYVPGPRSIYQGIRKVKPGTFVTLDATTDTTDQRTYWDLTDKVERARKDPFSGTPEEAVDQLEERLREVVGEQMVSDVPLGAFLSGGIDSTTIVALMQEASSRRVQTFTVGFHDETYNESDHARAVAHHLGTNHTELTAGSQDAVDLVSRLPQVYDEPFADASQIPTLLIAQLTSEHVTVSLSGDGGDEAFGGYNRYRWGRRIWEQISSMSGRVRSVAGKTLSAMSPQPLGQLYQWLSPFMPKSMRQKRPGGKISKVSKAMEAESLETFYDSLLSHSSTSLKPLLKRERGRSEERWIFRKQGDVAEQMMLWDMQSYLPDGILVKVDRATMAASLESRAPYLDRRILEFALSLPVELKIRHGKGKWILRQVLHRHVPKHLMDRPKQGFTPPIGDWLRGPLRDWGESLLSRRRLEQHGFLRHKPIQRYWKEHINGNADYENVLWRVLMFQAWYQEQKA